MFPVRGHSVFILTGHKPPRYEGRAGILMPKVVLKGESRAGTPGPHGPSVCRELKTMLSALLFPVIAQDISGAGHRAVGKDIS